MSSEYFKGTSLHLVRLKIFFELITEMSFGRHLHQIQGNWAGRNFATESRVNSRLITHARVHTKMRSEIYNYQRFNFRIINTSMGSWELRLTWLNCNQRSYIRFFVWTLSEDVRLTCTRTPELFFDLHVPFQLSPKEQNNSCKCIPEHD